MNDKRDIGKVISFLRNEVIPLNQPVNARLGHLLGKLRYRAPEQWQQGWIDLCELLEDELGDPAGCDWKERVMKVMNGEEQTAVESNEPDNAN